MHTKGMTIFLTYFEVHDTGTKNNKALHNVCLSGILPCHTTNKDESRKHSFYIKILYLM